MIYIYIFLTAIGLTPVAVLHDTFIYRQYTKYIERRIWEVQAVPRVCELYPGICLTTEGKARKKPVRIVVEGSVFLTQYCAGGQIEKNEMGGACGAYGGGERGAQGVGGETGGKEAIGETQT